MLGEVKAVRISAIHEPAIAGDDGSEGGKRRSQSEVGVGYVFHLGHRLLFNKSPMCADGMLDGLKKSRPTH
ncbi:hypothetical protein DOZ80_21850 [Pseudomonas fluorescens]|uniref:Uncharacterized protein n=1 Tax=Pseudomonas fluorescens TaxID=294 RepID=A0A327N258_PSEFL|nr:hypothetical protein DOZ80_21850 [Pseudomonas fluorescens]